VNGPSPNDVLNDPRDRDQSACCRAASPFALGARALGRGKVRRSGFWLLVDRPARRHLPRGEPPASGTASSTATASRSPRTSLGRRSIPLVGLHGSHVIVGLVMLGLCCVFAATGAAEAVPCRARGDGVLVLALRGRSVGGGLHRGLFSSVDEQIRAGLHALPAPTVWPMVVAARPHPGRRSVRHARGRRHRGLTLALIGGVGWWYQVLPEEQVEHVPLVPFAERAKPVVSASPRSSTSSSARPGPA